MPPAVHRQEVALAKANPGKWVHIDTCVTLDSAKCKARRVRRNILAAFREGQWKVGVKDWDVYIKYVGPARHPSHYN